MTAHVDGKLAAYVLKVDVAKDLSAAKAAVDKDLAAVRTAVTTAASNPSADAGTGACACSPCACMECWCPRFLRLGLCDGRGRENI